MLFLFRNLMNILALQGSMHFKNLDRTPHNCETTLGNSGWLARLSTGVSDTNLDSALQCHTLVHVHAELP